MNNLLITIYVTFIFTLFGCSVSTNNSKQGIVINQVHFFDSTLSNYVHDEKNFPDSKYWFRDSFTIQEIKALQTGKFDSGNVAKIEKAAVICYSFIDMKTGYTYGFGNLSDTSSLLHIHHIDEQKDKPFGAAPNAFWRYSPEVESVTKKWKPLQDTIIEKVHYKRMIWIDDKKPDHSEVLYARCDKKGTYFQFYNLIDKKNGCPFVIFESIYRFPSGKRIGLKTLYEFGPEKLNKKMNEIFDAWEKRIDTMPKQNIVYKSL